MTTALKPGDHSSQRIGGSPGLHRRPPQDRLERRQEQRRLQLGHLQKVFDQVFFEWDLLLDRRADGCKFRKR